MKQTDRHNYILQALQQKGAVSVSELSKELQATTVTIRKDLQYLEENNRLARVMGGAVPCSAEDGRMDQSRVPLVKNMSLKKAVAREAAKLINSGDSLIATSGVTPHLTVLYAQQCSNLKIVTDSMLIAEDLCRRPDYQVIVLGGEIYTRDSFVHGRDAVRQASRYMADKAIVTMDGVDADAGLTTLRVEGADTLKSILARARMRILVADLTKIGQERFCHIGDISIVDVLVTNRTDDPEKLDKLQKISSAGVQVIFADPNPEEPPRQ